ncbi:MAG: hypothetical protein Q4D85_06665 [Corynebacterium sp.]|uniref:hypothetical protein n=1 Tax=Corynebacterium sp. TaxID=1720 RepID=UPI0026DC9FE8|nr:hypothetical protein [Corynebacterium sp.]MDO5098427.1 hypothetical protein [Corynebacterium sp.]
MLRKLAITVIVLLAIGVGSLVWLFGSSDSLEKYLGERSVKTQVMLKDVLRGADRYVIACPNVSEAEIAAVISDNYKLSVPEGENYILSITGGAIKTLTYDQAAIDLCSESAGPRMWEVAPDQVLTFTQPEQSAKWVLQP